MTIQASPKLSTLQLELLKIYAFQPTERELLEVKIMLGRYFAHRFAQKAANIAAERGISNEDLDKWLDEDGQ